MLVKKDRLKAVLSKLAVFTSGGCGAGDKTTPVLFEAKEGHISLTACDGSNFGVFTFENDDPTAEMSFVTEYSKLQSAAALRGDADFSSSSPVRRPPSTTPPPPPTPTASRRRTSRTARRSRSRARS